MHPRNRILDEIRIKDMKKLFTRAGLLACALDNDHDYSAAELNVARQVLVLAWSRYRQPEIQRQVAPPHRPKVKRFARDLAKLQEGLGRLNDVETARRLLARLEQREGGLWNTVGKVKPSEYDTVPESQKPGLRPRYRLPRRRPSHHRSLLAGGKPQPCSREIDALGILRYVGGPSGSLGGF